MYVQWYAVTRHLRERLGKLEKAVEIVFLVLLNVY